MSARLLAMLLFAIAFLLTPTRAHAAKPYGVVTVDLRPEVGEVPTHLCVVSQGKGPRTRQALAELLRAPAAADGSAEATEEHSADPLILDPATWGGILNPDR